MLRSISLILVLGAPCLAGESVVWQIGTPDRDYKEFAIAGNHEAYQARFAAKPLVYRVGSSKADHDWPFIQPGPVDAWAGRRVHPFTIQFSLPTEPKGIFKLIVEFCDTQGMVPPRYSITVGGRTGHFQLPRGGGDASLKNASAGKPHRIEIPLAARFFHPGLNEIVLACTEGSWVQYDAITLLNEDQRQMPEPRIRSVTARATPMFIRSGSETRRAVDVTVALTASPADLRLRVEAAGTSFEVPVRDLPFIGDVSQEIGVPDSDKPVEVKVIAVTGEDTKSTTVMIPPQRKWRIFVAPSAHTDIGYTDLQPKCRERHDENLDLAADLIDRFPDFKWNCEVAWQAENYLADREGEKRERFLRLARERRLGVQALYCNILTGLCAPEEFCRLTYVAHSLHRDYGIPYGSAMINDVPTWVGSLPMVLAGSGIRYFSGGSNNTRAVTFQQMYDKCPCWWEGPDGSRVLMMFQPSYAYAARMGLQSSVAVARERLLKRLAEYEAREYPYDAIYLNGAVSDNQPLNQRLAEVAAQWNKKYAFPRIVLCHNAEFYEYIEEHFADQLPVFRGSGGTYWEDGAGSSARETALSRAAHETTANAERLFALTHAMHSDKEYPQQSIYAAWRNSMLYDEHTWGAHCSISQPESEFTTGQWKIKAQFAHDAHEQSQTLLSQATNGLQALVQTENKSLLVVNPMSWSRGGVVETRLPPGMAVVDPQATCCQVGEQTLLIVKNVPACGYRVLKCESSASVPAAQPMEGTVLESKYYRVSFDPATGAIVSIFDKELGRELVDPEAPYNLNDYLYVSGGKGTSIERSGLPPAKLTISTPKKATLSAVTLGELGQRMTVQTSTTMTPDITSDITVYNDVKRIDIRNRLTKELTYEKEAAYFAFPFAASQPTIRYEVPCAVLRPDQDLLPGACLDWFTVQHFVELEAGDAAITWSTPDAPLVCFQDINRGKWQTDLPLNTGHLYAYVMNNYWFTNYLAGQGGQFTFRFSITSRAKSDTVAAAHFGWGVSNPLIMVPAGANPGGPLSPEATSLIEVAEPNVLIIGMKKAETSDALVVRLWESAGKATTAHLRLGHLSATRATLCNLVEDPMENGQRPVHQSTIDVPIRASGLATVLIE